MSEGKDFSQDNQEEVISESSQAQSHALETESNIGTVKTGALPPSFGAPTRHDTVHPLIGTLFEGKYRIEDKLGEGGMGVVYRATHIFMERPVAIKFLHAERLTDSAAIERFKREARAAGCIQHPHATAVTDFGVANGNIFYLVMEYLEGRTLREGLRSEGRLPLVEAIRIISETCEAVEAAHKCKIIHRDLKPDNIFLQLKEGIENVKVLDFGIAKIPQSSTTAIGPSTEIVMGTPQ